MDIKDLIIGTLPDPINEPFPHIISDNFLNLNILNKLLESFPDIDEAGWNGNRDVKMEMGRDSSIWPEIGQDVFKILLSKEFCNILSTAFNIPRIAGTTFGAGYHISDVNSSLPMHIDWQEYRGLYRWLNVHIFLNKDWLPHYGGELELGQSVAIEPKFGRFVSFLSSTKSLHGHPNKWKSHIPRKSIAVYYFSNIPVPGYDAKLDPFRRIKI